MSLPIVRTPRAEEDLIEIWARIAGDNPAAADRQLDLFEARFRALAATPLMGAAREDIAVGLRCLPVGRYVIPYRCGSDAVEIVRVIHGPRDLDRLAPRSYRRRHLFS